MRNPRSWWPLAGRPPAPGRPAGGPRPCTASPRPALECEALVKIAYADQGTGDGPLANLAALIDDTTAKLRFGDMIAASYLHGHGRSKSACR